MGGWRGYGSVMGLTGWGFLPLPCFSLLFYSYWSCYRLLTLGSESTKARQRRVERNIRHNIAFHAMSLWQVLLCQVETDVSPCQYCEALHWVMTLSDSHRSLLWSPKNVGWEAECWRMGSITSEFFSAGPSPIIEHTSFAWTDPIMRSSIKSSFWDQKKVVGNV